MKVFAVVLGLNGARWLDSQWVEEKSATDRRDQVALSYKATNQTCHELSSKVVPLQVDDARLGV